MIIFDIISFLGDKKIIGVTISVVLKPTYYSLFK